MEDISEVLLQLHVRVLYGMEVLLSLSPTRNPEQTGPLGLPLLQQQAPLAGTASAFSKERWLGACLLVVVVLGATTRLR